MALALPSLSDIEASVGAFVSSGKLGQVGAGAAAADAASKLQTDVLSYMNKAGAFLGPILGTAGVNALAAGAAGTATTAQESFNQKYLGGYSYAQIGGVVAVGALALYLALRRK